MLWVLEYKFKDFLNLKKLTTDSSYENKLRKLFQNVINILGTYTRQRYTQLLVGRNGVAR